MLSPSTGWDLQYCFSLCFICYHSTGNGTPSTNPINLNHKSCQQHQLQNFEPATDTPTIISINNSNKKSCLLKNALHSNHYKRNSEFNHCKTIHKILQIHSTGMSNEAIQEKIGARPLTLNNSSTLEQYFSCYFEKTLFHSTATSLATLRAIQALQRK